MTARLMKSSALADTFSVEKTRKPARPAAKPTAAKAPSSKAAAARKRAPAAKPTVTPPVELTSPGADRGRGRRLLTVALAGLVVLVVASVAAGFLFMRGDGQSRSAAPTGVSAGMLASFASSHDGPVYWAGSMSGRTLELTTTGSGTFVRYLPQSASVGDSERAITVATYPLQNAFATAVTRSKSPQMTSRETAGGGVVVWNVTRPTSVYLAYPGVPQLVEVYAPDPDQARTLAFSGRIRPVR